jgi:hypothetical protein
VERHAGNMARVNQDLDSVLTDVEALVRSQETEIAELRAELKRRDLSTE